MGPGLGVAAEGCCKLVVVQLGEGGVLRVTVGN